MPKWLPRVLLRIHELVAHGHVRFTHKANEELKALSLNEEDIPAETDPNAMSEPGVMDVKSRAPGKTLDNVPYSDL